MGQNLKVYRKKSNHVNFRAKKVHLLAIRGRKEFFQPHKKHANDSTDVIELKLLNLDSSFGTKVFNRLDISILRKSYFFPSTSFARTEIVRQPTVRWLFKFRSTFSTVNYCSAIARRVSGKKCPCRRQEAPPDSKGARRGESGRFVCSFLDWSGSEQACAFSSTSINSCAPNYSY